MNLFKKCVAELIGTAVLCFAACGVAVVTSYSAYYSVWWIATSLAFGLVIVAMAYSIGNISGCHINPAVSLAMLISGKMTLKEFLAYVGAQIVGAFIGSALLGLCLHNLGGFTKLGGNTIQIALLVNNESLNAWSYIGAFIVELILTFVFVLTILGVTDSKFHDGKLAGLVIGGSLTLVHLIGLGFTGTSVNPARSLAPAVLQAIAGDTTSLSQVWIWILAPLAGGALAALVYKFIAKTKEKKTETEPDLK